jgi:hypothetical protein
MKTILLPLLLVNISVAENHWKFFELELTILLTGISIIFTLLIIYKENKFKLLGIILISSYILVFFVNIFLELYFLTTIKHVVMFYFYVVAGALIFGENSNLLHKQFTVFITLSLIVMFIQITGWSNLVMIWDTSYLDDPLSDYDINDAGKFKNYILQDTLFKQQHEITHFIGQARPSGLTHNNNILSFFLLVGVAINLSKKKKRNKHFIDIIYSLAVIFSMSKLAIFGSILLYLTSIIFNIFTTRTRSLKMLILLFPSALIYWILFPGLMSINFSEINVLISLLLRLVDLLSSLGILNLLPNVSDLFETNKPSTDFEISVGYTTYSTLINNGLLLPLIIFSIILYTKYKKEVKYNYESQKKMYYSVLYVLILSQFGVPMYLSPIFYILLGFTLSPIILKDKIK